MKRVVLSLLIIASVVAAATAQTRSTAHVDEMKKFDFLLGRWSGEGWIEMTPGQRLKFKSNETVDTRLGGSLLIVEGKHSGRFPGRSEEVVVHHAVAVISYDESERKYRFNAHLIDGRYVPAEGRFVDGGLQWGFRDPKLGEIRYTIKLNQQGQWFEIGELSTDGQAWRKFFEMNLNRLT